jgi:signal peptidase I
MLENAANTVGSSRSAERSALLAEVLRRGQSLRQGVRLRVFGESMLPALWPGDVVEIQGCSLDEARPGEIVLALRDGRLFLHRFVARCAPDTFLLRGDSMSAPDLPYPSDAFLGRLARSTYGGNNSCAAPRLALAMNWSRTVGMLLCYCSLARRLALKLHSRQRASAPRFRYSDPVADISSAKLGPS